MTDKPAKEKMLQILADMEAVVSGEVPVEKFVYSVPAQIAINNIRAIINEHGPRPAGTLGYHDVDAFYPDDSEPGEKRGEGTGESSHRAANTNLIDRCSDEPPHPLPPDLKRFYEKKGYIASAPSPAPLPAEVEAAMNQLHVWDFIPDGWEVPLGFDHVVANAKTALATIRAALTEARKPKRVSREWVDRQVRELWPKWGDVDWDDVEVILCESLKELGIEVEP